MKAAFIERHGGPEVLKFGEMLDPVAASGEVVVDIVAASVNGADWKVREGTSGQLSKFPYSKLQGLGTADNKAGKKTSIATVQLRGRRRVRAHA